MLEEEGAKESMRELHSFPASSFLADTGPSVVLQLCRNVRSVESSIHHSSKGDRALTLFPGALARRAGCVRTLTVSVHSIRDTPPGATRGLSGELWNVSDSLCSLEVGQPAQTVPRTPEHLPVITAGLSTQCE